MPAREKLYDKEGEPNKEISWEDFNKLVQYPEWNKDIPFENLEEEVQKGIRNAGLYRKAWGHITLLNEKGEQVLGKDDKPIQVLRNVISLNIDEEIGGEKYSGTYYFRKGFEEDRKQLYNIVNHMYNSISKVVLSEDVKNNIEKDLKNEELDLDTLAKRYRYLWGTTKHVEDLKKRLEILLSSKTSKEEFNKMMNYTAEDLEKIQEAAAGEERNDALRELFRTDENIGNVSLSRKAWRTFVGEDIIEFPVNNESGEVVKQTRLGSTYYLDQGTLVDKNTQGAQEHHLVTYTSEKRDENGELVTTTDPNTGETVTEKVRTFYRTHIKSEQEELKKIEKDLLGLRESSYIRNGKFDQRKKDFIDYMFRHFTWAAKTNQAESSKDFTTEHFRNLQKSVKYAEKFADWYEENMKEYSGVAEQLASMNNDEFNNAWQYGFNNLSKDDVHKAWHFMYSPYTDDGLEQTVRFSQGKYRRKEDYLGKGAVTDEEKMLFQTSHITTEQERAAAEQAEKISNFLTSLGQTTQTIMQEGVDRFADVTSQLKSEVVDILEENNLLLSERPKSRTPKKPSTNFLKKFAFGNKMPAMLGFIGTFGAMTLFDAAFTSKSKDEYQVYQQQGAVNPYWFAMSRNRGEFYS